MKTTEENNTINAKVINNNLIISSLDSLNPILLRIDMNKTLSVSLDIKESKDKFNVVITHQDGSENDISSFPTKLDALTALRAISEAMFEDRKHSNKCTRNKKKSLFKKVLKFFLLIFILLFIVFLVSLRSKDQVANINSSSIKAPSSDIGTPMPMDDFFKNK